MIDGLLWTLSSDLHIVRYNDTLKYAIQHQQTAVVYDQGNRNLLLVNSANCRTNLVPIGSGVDTVPSITGACAAAVTSTSIISSTTWTSTSKAIKTSTTTISTLNLARRRQ